MSGPPLSAPPRAAPPPAAAAPPRPAEPPPAGPGFGARAVLLSLAGAVVIVNFQIVSKIAPSTVALPVQSVLTIFTGPIFYLALLATVNVFLRRWWPRAAFRPAEFTVAYAVTTVAAAIGSQDAAMQLWPMFLFPFRESQAQVAEKVRGYIPEWLIPRDPRVVEPYYLGGDTFWQPERVAAWLVPFAVWMTWLFALGATMWAWNVILRRRWVDQDRLSFPSAQLPLELCRAAGFGGAVSGRLFWGGVLLATALEWSNRLSEYFPALPSVPVTYNATPIIQGLPEPWNALAPMSVTWGGIHLGICYFIPLDILFSSWFFYLARKGLEVFGFSMGWRNLGWDAAGFPFTRSQAAGAWVALFFLLVWAERRHLLRVLRASLVPFARAAVPDDSREPGSYRWAGRILVAGTLYLLWFGMASGMTLAVAVSFYAFFWMLQVTMTRVYAQVGPPFLELYFLDPQRTITTAFGTQGVSPRALTLFSLMYWIVRTERGQPMAHQLTGFYLADRLREPDSRTGDGGVAPRAMGRLVLLAFTFGAAVCLVLYLHWVYRVGEDQFVQGGWRETFSPLALARINEWVNTPKGPQWGEIGFMLLGGGITLGLAKLSYVLPGFPFHPIGFALAMVYTLEYNWPAFLAIWVGKGLILRLGGRDLYTRLVPFFLGLVLGGVLAHPCLGLLAAGLGWNR